MIAYFTYLFLISGRMMGNTSIMKINIIRKAYIFGRYHTIENDIRKSIPDNDRISTKLIGSFLNIILGIFLKLRIRKPQTYTRKIPKVYTNRWSMK